MVAKIVNDRQKADLIRQDIEMGVADDDSLDWLDNYNTNKREEELDNLPGHGRNGLQRTSDTV